MFSNRIIKLLNNFYSNSTKPNSTTQTYNYSQRSQLENKHIPKKKGKFYVALNDIYQHIYFSFKIKVFFEIWFLVVN